MSCNSPNKVFYTGFDPITGKHETAFTSRKFDHVVVRPDGSFSPGYGFDVQSSKIGRVCYDYDLVPCGQCLGCRLDRSRQWAVRLMLEKKSYPDNEVWFVTCTYDEDFLPAPKVITDTVTGEVRDSDFNPLVLEDHQKFMKRLRKAVDKLYPGKKLRYFVSGEYGSISYRPHFHYVIYGLPLNDLVTYKVNFRGDIYYNSSFLDNLWKKGFVVVSSVSFDAANYVARYITKKHLGKDGDFYEKVGLVPEFSCMSRRPGLASSYFENNFTDLLLTDNIVLPSADGGFVTSLPRYFDTIVERMSKLDYVSLKEERSVRAQQQHDTLLARRGSTFDEEDIFDTRERTLKKRTILRKGEI